MVVVWWWYGGGMVVVWVRPPLLDGQLRHLALLKKKQLFSYDHKPSDEGEAARVQASGGFIVYVHHQHHHHHLCPLLLYLFHSSNSQIYALPVP